MMLGTYKILAITAYGLFGLELGSTRPPRPMS